MTKPRALILRAPGTNCDRETAHAFERAGAESVRVTLRRLAAEPGLLDACRIVCIPGGFSYGDDIASGRIFAVELRVRLGDMLEKFRDRGGLILGICNGFQVLMQTGLLLPPGPDGRPQATLAANTSGRFVDRWVHLRVADGRCAFLQGISQLELPVAHGEGRFATDSSETCSRLESAGHLVLRYAADSAGASTNPNGAEADVAGVCDATGRVFGLMPHPERFVDATQHPSWSRRRWSDGLDPAADGAGLAIFASAVSAAR